VDSILKHTASITALRDLKITPNKRKAKGITTIKAARTTALVI